VRHDSGGGGASGLETLALAWIHENLRWGEHPIAARRFCAIIISRFES
jgi:hypothetical protein